MITALLLSLAHAAPAFHVAGDTVVPTGPALAQLLFSAAGEPRLLIHNTSGVGPTVLVPSAEGWVERPLPRALVVEGPSDLVALLQPVDGGGGRLVLEGGRWVAQAGAPLPAGVTGPAALDTSGRVSALGYEGGALALWTEGQDGAWKARSLGDSSVTDAWAQMGGVLAVTDAGMVGARTLRRPLGGFPGLPTGGLDARGAPALAWWTGGEIRVSRGGAILSLPTPRDVRPDAERCVEAPCEAREHAVSFARFGGLVPSGDGLLLPYAVTTITHALQCRPYDGPFHPCDPAGQRDTCPDPPTWSCDGPEARSGELRLARIADGRISELPLPPIPGLEGPLTPWDAATDPQGRLHLLVEAAAPQGWSTMRYLVLSERAETLSLPSGLAPLPSVHLESLDETALGLAGFATGVSAWAGDPMPSFAKGEARTGGSDGPGWWTASLAATPADRPVALEARLALESPAACGSPELRLIRGSSVLTARIAADGLRVGLPDGTELTAPGAPSRVRLELSPQGSAVLADGEVVARGPGSDGQYAGGSAMFGDQVRCPAGTGTRVRWQAVSLER